jgi:uncharacterized pyridoxamine 5'-phosphate oxidase family protein
MRKKNQVKIRTATKHPLYKAIKNRQDFRTTIVEMKANCTLIRILTSALNDI